MPPPTAQGFSSTAAKATFIKILVPAGCFYELHSSSRGKNSLPGLAITVESQDIASFKGHALSKMFITCVCERQYLFPGPCQSVKLLSSEAALLLCPSKPAEATTKQ